MIVDIDRFVAQESPYWDALEAMVVRAETRAENRWTLEEAQRLYYLYQRASEDLVRLRSAVLDQEYTETLESLVARAYAAIHAGRDRSVRFSPWRWASQTFPQTFRRHSRSFAFSCIAMLIGSGFGAFILAVEPDLKPLVLPFSHLLGDPSERVEREESAEVEEQVRLESTFAAQLMANNIRVSILALALGITWCIGTVTILFYNGVILGAVVYDYVMAGETVFLIGWLLPHGSIEIPAILIGGQAGLVLGSALLGWGATEPMRRRFRAVAPDLMHLIIGVALLLIWAGIVESFFSQYHEPYLPYELKIAFGTIELALLIAFLSFAGSASKGERDDQVHGRAVS